MRNLFTVIVKITVIIFLTLAVFQDHEYSYYTLVRWVVCASSVYLAYVAHSKHLIGLMIFFITTSLLFNPFIKVWLQKSTWHIVDIGVATIIALSIAFDFKKNI
jgi:hypothetical protein